MEHRKSIELQPNGYDPRLFSLIENTTAGDSPIESAGYWIGSMEEGRKNVGKKDRSNLAVDWFELCSSIRLIERILS